MQTINFNKIKFNDGDWILDLGCGEGRHTINAYLYANINTVGVDLCFDDILQAKIKAHDQIDSSNNNKSFSLSVGNALQLPFADNTFDKIICSEVLEHIPDWQGALKEIYRILKPSGQLAASVPRFGPEWICWALSDEYHANEGGHIRIFKEKQLRSAIENQGMYFKGKHWAHALHSPYWWLKCLFWKEQENSKLVQGYHRLLVWDMMSKPKLTRAMDKILNPVIGKSVVMYFEKGSL